MNLELLIPTLQLACAAALAHHHTGTLGPRAALVIAFDPSENTHVLYCEDTDNFQCPSYIVLASVCYGAGGLIGFTQTIAGLNISREQEIERMTYTILPNLAHLLYALKSTDERISQLASILSQYTVAGIINGIKTTITPTPMLAEHEHPERN